MKSETAPPKHAQVRERLRKRINSGEFAPGTRLPPEIELFKMLMASNTTVVRALNDLVREGLIVRRRGSGTFVAEHTHPPLMHGRHLKLGILWYHSVRVSLFDSFCHRLSLGAMQAWGMHGVEPELDEDRAGTFTRGVWSQPARGVTVECLANEWHGHQRAPSLDVVRKAGYDGVLTLGILEEAWLEELLGLGLPTVIVDFPTQRFATQADLVYADPQSGYRAAVDHLVARGLKRIHFVGASVWDPQTKFPDPSHSTGYRFAKRIDPDTFLRLSAYRQAIDAHGIQATDRWIHHQTHEDRDLAPRLASLPESDRPQALICHDVEQAERLIIDCADCGLKLEAAGACDRPRVGRALNIRLDGREMGAVAGEMLMARIRQPQRPFLNVGVRMAFVPPFEGNAPAAQSIAQANAQQAGQDRRS